MQIGAPDPQTESAVLAPQHYFAYAILFDVLVYDVNVIENGANVMSNSETGLLTGTNFKTLTAFLLMVQFGQK